MPEATSPRPRLLFVEDDAVLREHLAQKLSDQYVVDTAGNGNEALLAVMRAKPALVLTDIVMPDMDGVELLKTLRQSPGTRAIPVLLISGRAADEYRIEGFEEGADGFLAKPYTERELRALIGAMLRSAQMRSEAAHREARDRAEQGTLIERAELQHRLVQLHSRENQLRENEQRLASVARGLRNPLAPIRDGLRFMRQRLPEDELSHQLLNELDRQVSHLEHLVDDLLHASRTGRGDD